MCGQKSRTGSLEPADIYTFGALTLIYDYYYFFALALDAAYIVIFMGTVFFLLLFMNKKNNKKRVACLDYAAVFCLKTKCYHGYLF